MTDSVRPSLLLAVAASSRSRLYCMMAGVSFGEKKSVKSNVKKCSLPVSSGLGGLGGVSGVSGSMYSAPPKMGSRFHGWDFK